MSQNTLHLGNQEVVFAVSSDGGATISTSGKELAIIGGGDITMVQKDPSSGAETSFDMKTKFDQIDSSVGGKTSAVETVENSVKTFEGDVTTFYNKYNTKDDDTISPPTEAHETSVHKTLDGNLADLITNRGILVNNLDTKLEDEVDFIRGLDEDGNTVQNSDSLAELKQAVSTMKSGRTTAVAMMRGAASQKLQTDVTDTVETVDENVKNLFENCEGLLCDKETTEILKNIINDINRADRNLLVNIDTFSRETYALASDVKSVLSNTGATAIIRSESLQQDLKPYLNGTLQMEAGRSFYLFFNSVAFDITPYDGTVGIYNWVLDFNSEQNPPLEKQVHSDEVLVVRAGCRLEDRNDIAIIEYAGNEKNLTKIVAVQKLIIDNSGPLISINDIVPVITNTEYMQSFTISGSVGEVGIIVEMILTDDPTNIRMWRVTTGQDGEYSFSPYVVNPVGGTALPQTAEKLVHRFRLEATNSSGGKSVTSDLTWTVNDTSVDDFTVDTGTKYTSVRPTFSGTVEAGSTVSLPYASQILKSEAGQDKAWSITIPDELVALSEGKTHTLVFTATDPSGNTLNLSKTVKVWTQGPVFGSEFLSNTIGSSNYPFSVQLTPAAGMEFGGVSSVELIVEDSTGTPVSNAGTISHTGNLLSGMLSLPGTNEEYDVKLIATNNFGIQTTVTEQVTLNTTTPSLSIMYDPQLDKNGLIKVSGTWSDPTHDDIPTITVEINSVIYKSNDVTQHTNSGHNTGFWKCILQYAAGQPGVVENGGTPIVFEDTTYTVVARLTDSQGDVRTTTRTMLIDSSAPVLSIDSTNQFQNHATDYEVHIKLKEPALKSLTLGIASQTVNLLNPSTHPDLTLSSEIETNSSNEQEIIVKPGIELSDQEYEVAVSAMDIYGRTTRRAVMIHIDTQAPQVTVNNVNTTTKNRIVTFSGTIGSSTDTVEISYPQGSNFAYTHFSSAQLDTENDPVTWSLQGDNVSYGGNYLYVKVTDLANNSRTTWHYFEHKEDSQLGTFTVSEQSLQLNPEIINVYYGQTIVSGVVDNFENIDYIEANLNGEYHKLVGANLEDAFKVVPSSYPPALQKEEYREITFMSGQGEPSYVNGIRLLAEGNNNLVMVVVKWANFYPETVWSVRQTYNGS